MTDEVKGSDEQEEPGERGMVEKKKIQTRFSRFKYEELYHIKVESVESDGRNAECQ